MHYTQLKNKKILLAPCNEQSIEFASYLEEKHHIAIECFLDKEQKNALTYPYQTPEVMEADFIMILSPNYCKEITDLLLKQGVAKQKLLYVLPQRHNQFVLYRTLFLYRLQTKMKYSLQAMRRKSNINHLELLRLKKKHKGKRAFIIGNGPSLRTSDLEKLRYEITFAANKIYLAFENTQWRPTYYFVVDKLVYIQNYQKIQELPLKKFFSIDMIDLAPRMKKACYFPIDTQHRFPQMPSLYANPLQGVNKGNTVVYAMAEFALYMGAKELYFVGVDFDFSFDEDPKQAYTPHTKSQGECNHFHKEYRKIGEKWNKPNLKGIENSFTKLRNYCQENEVKVYNATRGGKLEVLQRVDFDSLF